MVARAEIDMLDIKVQFLKMYGKTLYSFIKVSTGYKGRGDILVSKGFAIRQLHFNVALNCHYTVIYHCFHCIWLAKCSSLRNSNVIWFFKYLNKNVTEFIIILVLWWARLKLFPAPALWSLTYLSLHCVGRHIWRLPQNPAGAVWRRVKRNIRATNSVFILQTTFWAFFCWSCLVYRFFFYGLHISLIDHSALFYCL